MRWVAIGLMVTLAGCAARYPLGIPEDEWEQLSPDARLEARQAQAELDRERAVARREAAEARRAEAEAEALRLSEQRRLAPAGARVQCLVEGEARFGSRWAPMQTLAIDVVDGMQLEVPIRSLDGRYHTTGYAEFDGVTLSVCDRRAGVVRSPGRCVTTAATQGQFLRGTRQRVEADRFIRGRMFCEYPRW